MNCCHGHRSGLSPADAPCSEYKGEPIRSLLNLPGRGLLFSRDRLEDPWAPLAQWAKDPSRWAPVDLELEMALSDWTAWGPPSHWVLPGQGQDLTRWGGGFWDPAGIGGAV